MEKEDIIRSILSVCNNMGVYVKTKVKTANWKADIVTISLCNNGRESPHGFSLPTYC